MLFDSGSVHPYGSFWLDVVDKGIKGIAVIVAAIWTYFRADTYRRKIEPSVSGELFSKDGEHYALVLCRLKNLGQSKYVIRQKGTYLGAEAMRPRGRETLQGSEVFKDHAWIEPGEQIDESIVLRVPDPKTFVAVRFALRVVSKKVEWNASCILKETDPTSNPMI